MRSYLGHLAATVAFPILWMRSLRFAGRQSDPRGRIKVMGAILASIAILAIGAGLLYKFHEDSRVGMYDELDGRVAAAIGEADFQASIDDIDARLNTMAVALKQLNATVMGPNVTLAEIDEAARLHQVATEILAVLQGDLLPASRTTEDVPGSAGSFQGQLAQLQAHKDRLEELARKADPSADGPAAVFGANFELLRQQSSRAVGNMTGNATNHLLYLRVAEALEDQDDQKANALIREADAHNAAVDRAFAIKDDAYADMVQIFFWFLIPCLIAAFYAPLVFAMGHVLNLDFEESDTVGYRPYPSGAMGWFLLLGGFGVPGLFFAAWSFKDLHERQLEGQIAL